MAKAHELLAVEGDLSQTATMMLAEATATFAKKPDHFKGHTRSLNYFDETRSKENVTETKVLVTTVDQKLDHVLTHLGAYYDAMLQKEATNQTAIADLIVNGKEIGKGLPATFLLGMETRLKSLREVVQAIPTLDPATSWEKDENTGKGVYVSPPQTEFKTEKKLEYATLAPATERHPAQVKDWTIDVRVARLETIHRSGMWSVARKAEVLDRIDTLMHGIKQARQRANLAEVVKVQIASNLFKAIFG